MKQAFIFLFFCLLYLHAKGQKEPQSELVQFSGVIITSDSLKPVPFVSIMIRNTNRGTISDYYGFFSFVAKMKDTVDFASIGFKSAQFVIPDTLTDQRCSMIQVLKPDTIMLREVVIFPWPTKEQFKDAFIRLQVPDDDLAKAGKNLDPEQLGYLASTISMDGSMNFRYLMENNSTSLYYSSHLPRNNLLNPIAWARFIQMWKNGAFKKKENKYKEGK